MVLAAAKALKFLLFIAMLLLGATAVPQILFLLFLGNDVSGFPPGAITDILIHLMTLIVITFGFLGISSWIRKQENVFY